MRSLTALCLALSPLPDTLPLVLEDWKKVLSVVCIQERIIWSSQGHSLVYTGTR